MPYLYRTIDTSTQQGLQQAERLHMAGWKIIRNGFWSLVFERKIIPLSRSEKCTQKRRPRRSTKTTE